GRPASSPLNKLNPACNLADILLYKPI
ncbi:hypothetical protein LINPERHAP2_LOCUS6106, partial [Linum perenne]